MNNALPSRRTVATGIAWSVPAIAATSIVPAFASSQTNAPQPGLNGWVSVGGVCRERTFDGTATGTGPDGTPYGMYVWDSANTPENTTIENATMVIYLPYSDYRFRRGAGGSSAWPNPTRCSNRDERDRNGNMMYAYCSTYTGAYGEPKSVIFNGVQYTATPLDGKPNWIASRTAWSCTSFASWIRREVTVNGVVTSCIRKVTGGPLECDHGGASGRARMSAVSSAATEAETTGAEGNVEIPRGDL